MPPKRKSVPEPPAKRDKKPRKIQNTASIKKMAAQELNVADLRSLLQMKLHQQGDTLDPDGYEYVSVQEGSSDYAEMRPKTLLRKKTKAMK